MRLSHVLAFAFLTSTTAILPAQSDGGLPELFSRSYTLRVDAEAMEQTGDLQGALTKYQQAQQILSTVSQNFPAFQPEVVNFRQRRNEEAINRVTRRINSGGGGAAPMAPNPGAPGIAPAPAAPGGYAYPAPAPQQGMPPAGYPPQQPFAPQPPAMDAQGGVVNPLDIINQQFGALQSENQELKKKVELYDRGYNDSLRERNELKNGMDMLNKQLADITVKAQALAQQSNSDSAVTREALQKLKDEAAMIQEMLKTRTQQLLETGQALEKLQQERDVLVVRIKKIEEENAQLKRNAVSPDDFNKVMAENTRLKGELEVARQQVEALKLEGGKKDQEIATLRTQITGIQAEVTKLRQENTAYQGQVAELTMQLKKVDGEIAAAPAPEKASPDSEKMLTENKTLRNIIMRQLRQQQRQLQAKEIVMAEMKKVENASQLLMQNLEDMTSGKVSITVDEEQYFSEPELKEIFAADGGVYATLEAKATPKSAPGKSPGEGAVAPTSTPAAKPNEGTSEEILMTKAGQALEKEDYKAAGWAYQDALRANPTNTTALINLAGIKLQDKQYDEAEVLLQKSLVYAPDNGVALHRLGVCYFQQGKLGEALSSFEKSVLKDKSNARAHHYMGIITSRQGNRNRAETEFKSALAIDPASGDAHFNLAVLYATNTPPDWTLARKHYKDAMERGIKPDASMERLLGKGSGVAAPKLEKKPAATASVQ